MRSRFISVFRAGRRFRTVWMLAALAVVCAAGYEASGGRLFSPAEPLPAGYYEDVTRVFEPFFTPSRAPDGTVWMVSGRTDDRFPLAKPAGTARVFVVGGSVAEFWYARDDSLAEVLEAAWPELRFEVVNCGVGGYDSSRERRVLAEVLGYRPDLVVLLSGNNQFRTRLSRWRHALFLVNRQMRRAAVFRRLQDGLRRRIPPEARSFSPAVRLRDFERDVRWMLRACRMRGVAVLPVALPANVRDCAPGGAPEEVVRDSALRRARVLLDGRRFDEVVCLLSPVVERADAPALAWFWLGRAFDGLGRDGDARAAYVQALERDESACRAWPALNAALRRLAAEAHAGVVGLDAAFAAMDPRGMPGMRQFRDRCHWDTGCYRVLSLLVAGELWKNRARYAFLPGAGVRPRSPLELPPPGKTPTDVQETLDDMICFCIRNPGTAELERNVSMLEGLAREGLFGAPRRIFFRAGPGRLPEALTRDGTAWAAAVSKGWAVFMLAESHACLRAGRVKDARGWLARAVKMRPALKQDPSALYLRGQLSRAAVD